VLERVLFPRLRSLGGDAGAREVLAGASVREVPCDGLGRPDDVDTPEELELVRR
jgi:CTP:molybdopterin cytidylyltransferase MocA